MCKSIKNYDDVYKILPQAELKRYIESFLIDDIDFVGDVDKCITDGRLIKMNVKERIEYFNNTIGNEARTYLLKILTLKHLSKILYKNIDGFTDEYWRERLNKC